MRIIWDGKFERVGYDEQTEKHLELVVDRLEQAVSVIRSVVECIREKGFALVDDKTTIRQA